MDAWAALQSIKARLASVNGVKTCRIGIEAGLSPDDYPIIRLVPERLSRRERAEDIALTVYYGMPVGEGDAGGLEAVYAALLGMEADIRAALATGEGWSAAFVDTVTDEDRLEQYKLFASRFEIQWPAAPTPRQPRQDA